MDGNREGKGVKDTWGKKRMCRIIKDRGRRGRERGGGDKVPHKDMTKRFLLTTQQAFPRSAILTLAFGSVSGSYEDNTLSSADTHT